jgi:predicted N-acetyltransferase YhbS
MRANIKYTSQPTLIEQQQILSLLDAAFNDNIYSTNTRYAYFNGYTSAYPNFVLLKTGDDVIGIAVVAKRKINLLNGIVDALSIGPVAIAPSYQRQGYSGQLMAGVNQLADHFGVTVLYIQGIDGFYNKYAFYTCLAKSKIVFNQIDIVKIRGVSIKPLTASNVNEVRDVYNNNASLCSCTSLRSKEDWDWLVKYCCKTWYFFEPTLVLINDRIIGYFCSDPKDPGRLREAVFDPSEEGIKVFLAGIGIYSQQKSVEKLEVMTWMDSPLYTYAKKNCNADFLQFFKRNGSQMMKILNYQKLLALMNDCVPIACSLKNIECRDDVCIFHFEFSGCSYYINIATKYVPGLVCGFFDFLVVKDFKELAHTFKQNCINYFDKLKSPFFFQGDNL